MQTITTRSRRSDRRWLSRFGVWPANGLLLAVLVGMMVLSACSSGSNSNSALPPPTLSGNWQYTMGEQLNPDPTKPSFAGGLRGGFLLQTSGTVKGGATYSILAVPPFGSGGNPTQCNTGVDQITGTINGQGVSLTAASTGGQTFTLTGTLSLDGSTMSGSYTSTDGAGCGIAITAADAQAWSAVLVPALTGSITGTFQSADGARSNEAFPVTGSLTQGENFGTSSTTVTGDLSFVDPVTNLSDYPCLASASVQGTISGNTVVLQLGPAGSPVGGIGGSAAPGVGTVIFESTSNGYVLHSQGGLAYEVSTASNGPCPPVIKNSVTYPGDEGNICLGVLSPSACQQPITLSQASLSFPAQQVGSHTKQTITLTNTSSSTLGNLTAVFANTCPAATGCTANYGETDNCGLNGIPSQGQPFILDSQQACLITVTFTPKETCADGAANCPSPLTATLTVNSPNTTGANSNPIFTVAVPITGTVVSATASSNRESDFNAERVSAEGLPPLPLPTSDGGHPVATLLDASQRTFQDVEHHAEID